MKWFKHDSTASLDAKLARVRLKYGMEGYGLYWFCLESIARNVETHNLSFELEEDAELLSTATNIHYERVQEMMTYMCNLGLFENCEGRITCLKMATRTDEYTQKLLRSITSVPTVSRHTPDKVPPIRTDKKRIEENRIETKTLMSPDKPVDRVPVRQIVDLYHQKLPKHPSCQKITKAREGAIKQRWREDLPALENWANYFDYIAQSPFLTGKVESTNGRSPFIATLEWITKASNYTKILEGRYHGV